MRRSSLPEHHWLGQFPGQNEPLKSRSALLRVWGAQPSYPLPLITLIWDQFLKTFSRANTGWPHSGRPKNWGMRWELRCCSPKLCLPAFSPPPVTTAKEPWKSQTSYTHSSGQDRDSLRRVRCSWQNILVSSAYIGAMFIFDPVTDKNLGFSWVKASPTLEYTPIAWESLVWVKPEGSHSWDVSTWCSCQRVGVLPSPKPFRCPPPGRLLSPALEAPWLVKKV